MKTRPIIASILDNDLYTFTVGQVAFKLFPKAQVEFRFINRSGTPFPPGFVEALKEQLVLMRSLYLTYEERKYLQSLGHFSEDYLDFLSNFRFNPDDINLMQDGNDLWASFKGTWVHEIMWEVPFLALVSELFYKLTGAKKDDAWRERIVNKAERLSNAGAKWMEFGTRRRFDLETQDTVVRYMERVSGFIGTSNVLLAMKYGVPVNGTMSHQGPMAMQAKYGVVNSNKEWRNAWRLVYPNKLNTFLPDTLSTPVFFRDFTKEEALLWNLRQDSGNPYKWMDLVLDFYKQNAINAKEKTAVFSDSLDPDKFIDITNKYRDQINVVGGIGTNLSNDCGHKPLSIVIKLTMANFGHGWVDVVKLSDDPVKHTGLTMAITATKKELGIV